MPERNIFPTVSEDSEISSKIERLFIDSFFELGLDQCITDPTHIKGRTLDLLVTNYSSCISNLKVFSDKYLCKSDHYLVTFQVNANVKYNKTPKRKILNFKKANWDALNNRVRPFFKNFLAQPCAGRPS